MTIPQGWATNETTLGFNQPLEDWQAARYSWKEENYTMYTGKVPKQTHVDPFPKVVDGTVELKPFQIRTFQLSQASAVA